MLYPSFRESPILSGWWLQLRLVCQPWKLNGMMIPNDELFSGGRNHEPGEVRKVILVNKSILYIYMAVFVNVIGG